MLSYLFNSGPRNLNLQNISNLNVVLLPQPIIAALSTKYLQGVEDRLVRDVATAASGMPKNLGTVSTKSVKVYVKGHFPEKIDLFVLEPLP